MQIAAYDFTRRYLPTDFLRTYVHSKDGHDPSITSVKMIITVDDLTADVSRPTFANKV